MHSLFKHKYMFIKISMLEFDYHFQLSVSSDLLVAKTTCQKSKVLVLTSKQNNINKTLSDVVMFHLATVKL